jgi:hypothetical protein
MTGPYDGRDSSENGLTEHAQHTEGAAFPSGTQADAGAAGAGGGLPYDPRIPEIVDAIGHSIPCLPVFKSSHVEAHDGVFDFAIWRCGYLEIFKRIGQAGPPGHDYAFCYMWNHLRRIPESGSSKVGCAYATNNLISIAKRFSLAPLQHRLSLLIGPNHEQRVDNFHVSSETWG